MGGAVVIPVIMEIHTDFLCQSQTPDMTLTRRNQMLLNDDIFSKVERKNKQTKTLTRTLQLPLHLLTDTTVATATTLTRLTTRYSYYSYQSYYSYHSYYTYYSYYTHYRSVTHAIAVPTAMEWH